MSWLKHAPQRKVATVGTVPNSKAELEKNEQLVGSDV